MKLNKEVEKQEGERTKKKMGRRDSNEDSIVQYYTTDVIAKYQHRQWWLVVTCVVLDLSIQNRGY